MVNKKHYDFLVKNWTRKVANVWACCVGWKLETETGRGLGQGKLPPPLLGPHVHREETHSCILLGQATGWPLWFWAMLLGKEKNPTHNNSNVLPRKLQDFQVVLSSVFDWESLEMLLNFSNNTSELIIIMFPLLANNFQFWNKPFFRSLALFRNYFAKMKHFKSSQFSTFPRSVDKYLLFLWESISVWKTST